MMQEISFAKIQDKRLSALCPGACFFAEKASRGASAFR